VRVGGNTPSLYLCCRVLRKSGRACIDLRIERNLFELLERGVVIVQAKRNVAS
jgi:hypothetical protein